MLISSSLKDESILSLQWMLPTLTVAGMTLEPFHAKNQVQFSGWEL
jgi:hypothetical protein